MECLGCIKKEKDNQECEEFNLYFEQIMPKKSSHTYENLVLLINNSWDNEIKNEIFNQITKTNYLLNTQIIEKVNPMYVISKKNLKLFRKNISRRNVKRFILVFLINPNFINSDLNIFLSLAELFMKYTDKNLYCLSYITLTNKKNSLYSRKFESDTDDAISLMCKKNTKKEMSDTKKKIDIIKDVGKNISYIKCFVDVDVLSSSLSSLFWKLEAGEVVHFDNFHVLKKSNCQSVDMNLNRYISFK